MMPERAWRVFAAAALLCAAPAASALQTPPQMMANVYRFSEAASVLEICFASEAFRAAPPERSAKLKQLAARLSGLVGKIGLHYRDTSLVATYEATRDRIASESRLKLHVKNTYEYCGEKLAVDLEKYVVENEVLLAPVFLTDPDRNVTRRPPPPGAPTPTQQK